MSASSARINLNPVILLACSHSPTALSLADLLESWCYQVEIFENGTDAMAAIGGAHPASIALLDMDLPAPSGVEIVRTLRNRHRDQNRDQRRTWTILLSSRSDKDSLRSALDCGCDDFLLSPPDAADLKVRIRIAERILALTNQVHKQSAELRYHSTHDSLTGLWNREALLSLVFQETDRVQRMKTSLSLMLLDLDDFSRINQKYGYEEGDRVLTELAARFRRQLRSYDLIGRCGEDEFLLALPGCNLEEAHILASRVRETILGRPFAVANELTPLTASFGLAVSRGRSPLVVLRESERALAEAKLAGKNCIRSHDLIPETPEPVLSVGILAAD